MNKVYLITCDWGYDAEIGNEILAVTDADNVSQLFNELVDKKIKNSFLSIYFKNGQPEIKGMPFHYERTNSYFNFEYNNGECFFIINVEEKEIMKPEPPKKTYRFTYREVSVGVVDIVAHSEKEARELFVNAEYAPSIDETEMIIGDLIEIFPENSCPNEE